MSTEAQIEANRANAQKSTGPVSAEGKAASSQNRFGHGFCGAFRVVDYENAEEYDSLLNALREEHDPATATEQLLVDRMAQHHWLSQRAQMLQSELFCGNVHPNADKLLPLYLRYQLQNERAFSKCLSDLLKLRAERRKTEIGFEREKQRAAQETRQGEAHEARMRRAVLKSKPAKLDFDTQDFIETRLPADATISSDALKSLLTSSIERFAAELTSQPASIHLPEAA